MEGFVRFIKSFVFAARGIAWVVSTESNMVVHLVAAAVVVALGCYFDITREEWCIVILCSAMVMMAEMLNTALEALTDLVKPEWHPLAGKVKDAAAGAVLIAAAGAAAAGVIIFWKYFFGA